MPQRWPLVPNRATAQLRRHDSHDQLAEHADAEPMMEWCMPAEELSVTVASAC